MIPSEIFLLVTTENTYEEFLLKLGVKVSKEDMPNLDTLTVVLKCRSFDKDWRDLLEFDIAYRGLENESYLVLKHSNTPDVYLLEAGSEQEVEDKLISGLEAMKDEEYEGLFQMAMTLLKEHKSYRTLEYKVKLRNFVYLYELTFL